MSDNKIADIVSSLLNGVHGISKTETIVGAPQKAGDATIIPVHRLKIAFGAASATAGAQGEQLGGKSGGHGAGGAVELDPVAAIAISKDGHAHLLTVEGDERSAWSAMLQQVPDILGRLAQSIGDRVHHELKTRDPNSQKLASRSAEAEAAQLSAKRTGGDE